MLRTLRCRYHQFTYVLINDPTTGYGIFAENMLVNPPLLAR
ncbi:MAG: hypothetical protein E7643_08580 [Ruminococcaceae bacterium]|nr:hypothetical protein [Oscillospiraceae bacterium]